MNELENPVTREEFQQLAQRVVSLEVVVRETLAPKNNEEKLFRPSSRRGAVDLSPQVNLTAPFDEKAETTKVDTPPSQPPLTEPDPEHVQTLHSTHSTSDTASSSNTDWEALIGTKWVEKVGAALVILGVSFFVKYAFDQGWINPALRIMMGVMFGFFLIGAGEIAQRRNLRSSSHALAATGLGAIYITLFAGASLYGMFGQTTTIALLAGVSTLGTLLALRYDAQPLAFMSAVGAFIAPMLVSSGSDSGEPGSMFLNYLLAVSAGFSFLSFKRSWRTVHGFTFISTWFFTFGMLIETMGYNHGRLPLAYPTLFFLEFFVSSLALRSREKNEKGDRVDLLMILANPMIFFGVAYNLLYHNYTPSHILIASLAFILAMAYALLSVLPYRSQDELLTGSSSALAVGFITAGFAIGIPSWATLAWCIEALFLLWAGYENRIPLLRTAARIVLALATFRLFSLDLGEYERESLAQAFLNPRFGVFFAVSATMGVFAWIHRILGKQEGTPGFILNWTGAAILMGIGMTLESPVYTTLLWMGLALVWIITTTGIRTLSRSVIFGIGLAIIALHALGAEVDAFSPGMDTMPFLNLRGTTLFALAGLMFISGRLLAADNPDFERGPVEKRSVQFPHLLQAGAHLFLLLGLSLETTFLTEYLLRPGTPHSDVESAKQFALSALWAAYASIAVAWGFLRGKSVMRVAGLGGLGIVVIKMLFVDLAEVETVWRILSFIGIGLLLLGISLAYHRLWKGPELASDSLSGSNGNS